MRFGVFWKVERLSSNGFFTFPLEQRVKMADIAMCYGEDCSLRQTCYRYRAEPDWRQGYGDFDRQRLESGEAGCEHFWALEGRQGVRLLEET